MPRLTMSPQGAGRGRRGYTMIELIVSMTLLAIIATVVGKLMLGQQQFFQKQSSQMTLRRELRTTMSAMPSDLRSISSSGGDLLNFDDNSITFRNVLGAAVVCAKPNNTTMDIPPLAMARTTLTSWYTQPQVGDSVFAFNEGLLRGAEDDVWTGLRITSITAGSGYCPGSPLTDAALDAGKNRYRITVTPVIPDSVKIGAGLRFVRSTKYSLIASATNQWYLNRTEYLNGGWSTPIPITGPFNAPSANSSTGIKFTFFDSTGTAVTNVANSRSVARIDLIMRAKGANSSAALNGGVVTDSLTFRIALRNRQ